MGVAVGLGVGLGMGVFVTVLSKIGCAVSKGISTTSVATGSVTTLD